MRTFFRWYLVALTVAALAACGAAPDHGAPLSFAPADTPYAYANLDPLPATVTAHWSQQMQQAWPLMFGFYDEALRNSKDLDDRSRRIATALLDEIKLRDSWEKLREIGFKPDMRVAFYGVGLVPVMRIELGDPAAFRATVERIERNIGEKLPTASTGSQDYWQLGHDKLFALMALQGSHLVLTIVPANASDRLKQALLGVTRPSKSLSDVGTLNALAKQHGYTPFGNGFVDIVRLTELLTAAAAGTDREFAQALDLPVSGADAVCHNEYAALAQRIPRLVVGSEELTAQRVRVAMQVELEPTLAKELAATLGAAPGTGAPSAGVFDMALALPLLKLKDFWIKQADAVAAKPFMCPALVSLNTSFRDLKAKIDTTLPPPFSDLTGIRASLTKLEPRDAGVPDMAGKLLFGSSNPMAAVAMAQLTLAPLRDLKLAPDSKPVAVPAGLAPPGSPPLFVAMSNNAIAIAAGVGEDAALSAYLASPAANEAVFVHVYFSGALYGLMARYAGLAAGKMPDPQRAAFDQQIKLFGLYEKWIRSGEFTLTATADGVLLRETIEAN